MSISNKVIESYGTIQNKFFDKLDSMKIDSVTLQEIKDALVLSRLDVMADILKEVTIIPKKEQDV